MAHHYQKCWVLSWNADSEGQQQLIKIFSEIYETKNFTFEPERFYDSTSYCVKTESRVGGAWFVGTPHYRRKNPPMSNYYLNGKNSF